MLVWNMLNRFLRELGRFPGMEMVAYSRVAPSY